MLQQIKVKNEFNYADRTHYIGGSDVAGILGKSNYSSPLKVYSIKKGLWQEKENVAMKRGKNLEDFIAKSYQEQFPEDVILTKKINNFGIPFHHKTKNYLLANVDGINETKNCLLEFKSCQYKDDKRGWGQEGTDNIPVEYYFQVMYYLHLSGYSFCHLYVYFILNNKFEIFNIQYNKKIGAFIEKKCTEFWKNHILSNQAPEPTQNFDAKLIYNTANDYEEAKQETNLLILEYKDLNEQIANLKKQKEEISSKIKFSIGEKNGLINNENKIIATFKQYEKTFFDKDKFKKDYPEIYSEYETRKVERKLFIK